MYTEIQWCFNKHGLCYWLLCTIVPKVTSSVCIPSTWSVSAIAGLHAIPLNHTVHWKKIIYIVSIVDFSNFNQVGHISGNNAKICFRHSRIGHVCSHYDGIGGVPLFHTCGINVAVEERRVSNSKTIKCRAIDSNIGQDGIVKSHYRSCSVICKNGCNILESNTCDDGARERNCSIQS